MSKSGLIVSKKEMTKIWVENKFCPVTIVKILPQEVIRLKKQEKDGYNAIVLGVIKKQKDGKKEYRIKTEFKIDESQINNIKVGDKIKLEDLEAVSAVTVIGTSKGKGFQGVMKRFNTKGGPHTHGSKFHRQVGSLGNRKPRRVLKGHPHAGRMGGGQITLKNISILDKVSESGEELLVLKGSLPGAYNGMLKIVL